MSDLFYKICRRLRKLIMSKEEYMHWEDNESFRHAVIEPHYDYHEWDKQVNPKLVFMINGFLRHGGLADRLRGAISTYMYAKEHNMDYRIYWRSPFLLEDYFLPNKVDWTIDDKDIKYSMPFAQPLYIGSYYKRFNLSAENERKLQMAWMDRIISTPRKVSQYHVYSNAHFGNVQFHNLFQELFKPHPRLLGEIAQFQKECGDCYIAASFRFVQLLGDFDDRCGGIELPKDEKEQYIIESISQIKKLSLNNGGKKVFVTSDSDLFIKRVQELPFAKVVLGEIAHVDKTSEGQQSFDKEFLDLLLMAKAEKIYRLHKEQMHYSGFPITAGMIGGIEVETIEY